MTCELFNASPSIRNPKRCACEATGEVLARSYPTLVWVPACPKHLRQFAKSGAVR